MNRIMLCLSAVPFLTTGCAVASSKSPIWVPNIQQVALVDLALNGGPAANPPRVPRPLDPTNKADRRVVSKLLGWMRQAQKLRYKPPSSVPHIGDHTLTFTLVDGGSFTVAPAEVRYGTGYGGSTSDVVVWLPDADRADRYRDPELAHWLGTGWRSDVSMVNGYLEDPAVDDISSIALDYGKRSKIVENTGGGTALATRLWASLIDATFLRQEDPSSVHFISDGIHRNIPSITFYLRGPAPLAVYPAYNCVRTPDGYHCSPVRGQVTVHGWDGSWTRLEGPQLASWVNGVWHP